MRAIFLMTFMAFVGPTFAASAPTPEVEASGSTGPAVSVLKGQNTMTTTASGSISLDTYHGAANAGGSAGVGFGGRNEALGGSLGPIMPGGVSDGSAVPKAVVEAKPSDGATNANCKSMTATPAVLRQTAFAAGQLKGARSFRFVDICGGPSWLSTGQMQAAKDNRSLGVALAAAGANLDRIRAMRQEADAIVLFVGTLAHSNQ